MKRKNKIIITDDGIGFDLEKTMEESPRNKHFGLFNMYQRAKLIDAVLSIKSSEEGTEVLLLFKLKNQDKEL